MFALAAASLFFSCAKPKVEEPVSDPYAFTFSVSAKDGVASDSGVDTAPSVRVVITGGEDVDYEVSFSVDGRIRQEHVANAWLNKARELPIGTFEEYSALGEHTVSGTVQRSDGNGEQLQFSASYTMYGLDVTDIQVVEAKSFSLKDYGVDEWSIVAQRGKVTLPAKDTGKVFLKISPEEANVKFVCLEGGDMRLHFEQAERLEGGIVSVPYALNIEKSGKTAVTADSGRGVKEFTISTEYLPTVGLRWDYVPEEYSMYAEFSEYTNVVKLRFDAMYSLSDRGLMGGWIDACADYVISGEVEVRPGGRVKMFSFEIEDLYVILSSGAYDYCDRIDVTSGLSATDGSKMFCVLDAEHSSKDARFVSDDYSLDMSFVFNYEVEKALFKEHNLLFVEF